jgi:hypothetical protein
MSPRLIMRRGTLTVGWIVLLVGCADSHVAPDGPMTSEAADGSVADLGAPEMSAPDEGADGPWICGDASSPEWTDFPTPDPCDEVGRAICQAWAQSLTRTHFAHTACEFNAIVPCQRGTICIPTTHVPAIPCICGPNAVGMDEACEANEVCVSDTPDGARYCMRACTD